MDRDMLPGGRIRSGAGRWDVHGNKSGPSQPPQSAHHEASTPPTRMKQQRQEELQQPCLREQQSLAVPHHHSESGSKHRRFASDEVSSTPTQAVRTTALRPTQPGSNASSDGGGWLGSRRNNDVVAPQNQQAQMRGEQQSKSPQVARYSASVRQRHQQQLRRQTVHHSQRDARPQRSPNYHTRTQRRQQQREHHRYPRHQQLPHRKQWSSNFRDGRGREVDQDFHRRREFQHNRNASGDQARLNHAMRRNTSGKEEQYRGVESSKVDETREYRKRGRGELEPEPELESSAGESISSKGGDEENSKRSKKSRWGDVKGESLRSPSHSESLRHRPSPDLAGSPFAATRESPHPSEPRVFYADSISSNAPKPLRVGTEISHEHAARPGLSTPSNTIGGESGTAATDVSVKTDFLPGSPLLSPRPGAADGATVLTSGSSPWQSSIENISNGSFSKKKKRRKKKKLTSGQEDRGGLRTDGDVAKFWGGPPEFLAKTMGLGEEIPLFHRVDVTVPESAASYRGVPPDIASTGSTIADQLYFAAAQAKAKALQLRKEAAKAYRQATKAARLAEAELKSAEARGSGGVNAAAAGPSGKFDALPYFHLFFHDQTAGTKEKGEYTESDFSDPGEFSEDDEISPGRFGVSPSSGVNPRGGGVDTAAYVGTPAPLEKIDGQQAPSSPPIANRYDVSSSEGGYADTDSDCGLAPRTGDPVNADNIGTPAVAMDVEKYEKVLSVDPPVANRYDVSSSEDCGNASSEDEGRGDGKGITQVSSWGRYDVSSSSSALSNMDDSDDESPKRKNSINGRDTTSVALPQPPPHLQSSYTPHARYNVSSTSSAASSHSSPSGRYDVSSYDSNDGIARQQQRRLEKNRKRRSQRQANKMLMSPPAMDMQPSPEWMLPSPPSSPSETCSDGYGRGFDFEEYKRFFEPVNGGDGSCPGGTGGLGLPHPLGLKIVQAGEAGLTNIDRSSNGCVDRSQRDLGVGSAPPNDAGTGPGKVRPPYQVTVVVPSRADFKWEKVNLQDPLRSHKSLLDRLAGVEKPLPDFSGIPRTVQNPLSIPPSAAAAAAPALAASAPLSSSKAAITESTMPMEEDGNPEPDEAGPPKVRFEDSQSSSGQHAVLDVNRESGNQHWGALINAENMPPIELDAPKRPRGDGGERNPSGGGGAGGGWGATEGEDPGTCRDQPPLPMCDDPRRSGKQIVDQKAYARMFPGGAVVTMKGFSLKDKSAVSAAFELCATMEPKSRPKFENKASSRNVTSPFTVHVSLNGVNYSPATAKSVKLAKQLAAINFLREVVGTREHNFSLKDLSTEAGVGAAALAAAVGKGNGRDDDDMPSVTCDAEAARLALDDGLPNHAQLLHDLAAAHPETPSFATYTYRSIKDSSMTVRGKAFRCTARLIRHSIDSAEVDRRREKEKEAMAAEEAARSALVIDPSNTQLLEDMKNARAMIDRARTTPVLTIGMISAVGDGASKKESKHKAAEALAYILLPECKTDAELRRKTKKIIDVYQKEKKERMEEEQRIAQDAKVFREKAEAAIDAPDADAPGADATAADAVAADATAADATAVAADATDVAADVPADVPAADAPAGAPAADAPAADAPAGAAGAPASSAGAPAADVPVGAVVADAPVGAVVADAPAGADAPASSAGAPASSAGAPASSAGAPAASAGAPAADVPVGAVVADAPAGAVADAPASSAGAPAASADASAGDKSNETEEAMAAKVVADVAERTAAETHDQNFVNNEAPLQAGIDTQKEQAPTEGNVAGVAGGKGVPRDYKGWNMAGIVNDRAAATAAAASALVELASACGSSSDSA